MPEEIRPGPGNARAFVSTSRPGTSGFAALSQVLRQTADIGVDALDEARTKEIEEVEDLLASPLITQEEVSEIESEANFPLARLKAQNRRGTLIAERYRVEAEEAVRNAPDAIEARRILRDIQAKALEEAGEDTGEAAGVRERFADIAPDLLAAATLRRQEARAREDIVNTDADLRSNLNRSPGSFVDALVGHVELEKIANGDMNAFHERTVLTLENAWLEGEEVGGPNLATPDVLKAIEGVLESGVADAGAEENKYKKLRKRILVGESARLRGDSDNTRRTEQAFHGNVVRDNTLWMRAHPGQPLPPERAEMMLNSAVTAAEVRAANEMIHGTPDNVAPHGVADTAEWKQARGILVSTLTTIENGVATIRDGGQKALLLYDALGQRLPASLRGNQDELQRIAGEAVRRAPAQALEFDRQDAENQKQADAEVLRLREMAKGFISQGDRGRAGPLLLQVAEIRGAQSRARREEQINAFARETGINLDTDIVNTRSE